MSEKGLTRRDFLKISAMVGGAAVLTACGGGKAETPAPVSNEPVVITIWMSDWGKEWNDPMKVMFDSYTKDVPPYNTVEWTFLPNVSEKLVSAITAGNPPDVTLIDEGYGVPKMARQKALIPLASYFEAAGVKAADFIPFAWETVLYKGEPFGVPGGAGTCLMMIDRNVWRDAGIDPDTLPEIPTWAQYKEWNSKLYKYDADGKVIRTGQDPLANGWSHIRYSLGFKQYSDDKTKLVINSPESVKAIEEWVSLLPEGLAYEDIATVGAAAPTTPYGAWTAGFRGMEMDGYWLFSALDKYYPDQDYFLKRLPTPNGTEAEQNLYTGWVWDMVLPKGSPHQDAGWSLIKYGFYEKAEVIAETLNWPSRLSVFPEFERRTQVMMGENNRMGPYLSLFSKVQVAGAKFEPWTPIFNQLGDQFGQAFEAIIRTKKPVQAAMDEVVAALQPELDKVAGDY
jgi:ABC-type glycerol-3-phosphate transport system substrate-binding protein